MKKVLIVGSARKDGGTASLANQIMLQTNWDVIDLNDYKIGHFDYEYSNKNDDYLKLMRRIIENYQILIFATPVYWYSMSGIMKVFFDRMTDLLTIEKDLGRKLRGKKIAVISNSTGSNLGESFWLPFSETAKYLGMEYIGNAHTISGEDYEKEVKKFIETVENKAK